MRVSTSMIYQQLTDKLSENAEGMKTLQGQLSTGFKYSSPPRRPILSDVFRQSKVVSKLWMPMPNRCRG